MDNQSRSSFWQGFFKQRECEKKITRTNYLHLAKGTSWLPQPSSLSDSPSSMFASQSVSVSPAWGLAQVHFLTCLVNSCCRQGIVASSPAREKQRSKPRVFLSAPVLLGGRHISVFETSACSCQGRCPPCCQMGTECATREQGTGEV